MPDRQPRLTTFGAIDSFFGGIGFVLTTPRLWGLAVIPAVVLVLLFGGFLALCIWGAASFDATLFGHDRGTWGAVGYWTLLVFLIFIGILIALLLALAFAEPLSGFALERISRAQTEAITGTHPKLPSLFASIWLSLCAVLFAVALGGSALVVLFVVNVFYPPAVVVTVPLKVLVCSWMLAWDLLDYPLGLRGMGLWKRLKWVIRHFGAFTLFGFLWASMAVIPGVVLVLLPMGVAGATQMVLRDDPRSSNESE
jgi:CysZ protein